MYRLLIAVLLLLAACASEAPSLKPEEDAAEPRLRYPYESSEMCRGCHSIQHLQYQESMHFKAYDNPLFKALYFSKVVPRAQQNPAFRNEARKCIACHAPVVFMNYTGLITKPAQAEAFETGITCDFCHTLNGYKANGDYEQNPSQKKQGPFRSQNTFHAEYSGYMQVAEFCGNCHNASNHSGLEVKSTFNEWRESHFAGEMITCQQCHMNKIGFLVNDKPVFERGAVAQVNMINGMLRTKSQEQLYIHSFPGAHSSSQIEGALKLSIQEERLQTGPDGTATISILVNNSRSGHNMPSGSSDLRFMWLDVTATTDSGTPLPVHFVQQGRAETDSTYAVAGASPVDAALLGTDVPPGRRLYRAVFADAQGQPSLFHFDTVSSVFDNRLKAGEHRTELVRLQLPKQYSGSITLTATLRYQGAPSSFTRELGVDSFPAVVIAAASRQLKTAEPQRH